MRGRLDVETATRAREPAGGAALLPLVAELVLCAVLLTLAAVPASSQYDSERDDDDRRRGAVGEMPAYCSIVAVEKVQLSNAAIITVKANGLLKTDAEFTDFMEEEEPGDWDEKETTRFPIRILNARSEVGTFVDINLYPISHLEVTIPPDAAGGIGLEMTTVLFTMGYARRVELTDFDVDGYSSSTGVSLDIIMSENQRSIIIIARSDRYIDVARREAAMQKRQQKARLGVGYENGRLYVHAVGVTAGQLLREISDRTGTKIALSEASPAAASMYLEDMTLPDALDVIARAYGLGVGRVDGGYVLAPGWPTSGAAYSFSSRRSFPIRHLPAEEAAELLPNVLDRYIHVDREHNAIVATGAPALLDKIGEDLAVVDQRPDLIEIEAIVVDTARTYDLVSELDLQFADGNTSLTSVARPGDISFRIVNQPLRRIRASLLALEERGLVKTYAEAHVTTRGGQYARIFSGQRQFYPLRTLRRRRQEIFLAATDVGVRLSGYYYPCGSGAARCWLRFRANNIVSIDAEGLPFVATREARSVLWVTDGDTIYVGGVALQQREKRRRKVPLLGDLPVVGRLFQSRMHAVSHRSLAVFLGVRIIDGGTVPADSAAHTDILTTPVAQQSSDWDPILEPERSLDG